MGALDGGDAGWRMEFCIYSQTCDCASDISTYPVELLHWENLNNSLVSPAG